MRAKHRLQLFVETLERRCLLSDCTVTLLTDSNPSPPGELRYCLRQAQDGLVDFAVTGRITIAWGPLFATSNVTVKGPGVDKLTISGTVAGPAWPIFDLNPPSFMSDVTLADGAAGAGYGGAVTNPRNATFRNVAFRHNGAP